MNILQKRLQNMGFIDRVIIGLITTAVCLLLGNIACVKLSLSDAVDAKIHCIAIVLSYAEFVSIMFYEKICATSVTQQYQSRFSPTLLEEIEDTRLGGLLSIRAIHRDCLRIKRWARMIGAVYVDVVTFLSGVASVAITVAASFIASILLLKGEFFAFVEDAISWFKGASVLQQSYLALFICGYVSCFILYGEKALKDFEDGMDRLSECRPQ